VRRAIALLLLVSLMAACSSNDLASQGERSRAGKDKKPRNVAGSEGSKGAGGKGDGGTKSAAGSKSSADDLEDQIDSAGSGGGSGDVSAPDDFGGGDAPTSGIDPSLARASAGEEDLPADAKKQGAPPPFTETVGAGIQGLGKNVRFTISFAGNVPDRLAPGQYMVMAFGVTGRKEGEGFAVGAVGDPDGWKPYAGADNKSDEFPGTFEISGSDVILEIPWSFVKGPRAFEWYASSGWYGKVANQTHWSFDGVPNNRSGDFPG
jgi:hypothetical protein